MDYDKTWHIHSGKMIRQACRTQQEENDWRRIVEFRNSMNPTQNAGNRLKVVEGTAGNRNADELALGVLHMQSCRDKTA